MFKKISEFPNINQTIMNKIMAYKFSFWEILIFVRKSKHLDIYKKKSGGILK